MYPGPSKDERRDGTTIVQVAFCPWIFKFPAPLLVDEIMFGQRALERSQHGVPSVSTCLELSLQRLVATCPSRVHLCESLPLSNHRPFQNSLTKSYYLTFQVHSSDFSARYTSHSLQQCMIMLSATIVHSLIRVPFLSIHQSVRAHGGPELGGSSPASLSRRATTP